MKRFLVIFIIAVFSSIHIFAQDSDISSHSLTVTIPEIALLDLEGTTSITLTPSNPTEAGLSLDFSTAVNNSIWLNYTSIVATGKTRYVTARISSGTIPSGLALKVAAGTVAGSGQGTFGMPAGQITLSSATQNFITGIGSCYTESGANTGHRLSYSLTLTSADSYNLVVQGSTTVNVTYTITEDN